MSSFPPKFDLAATFLRLIRATGAALQCTPHINLQNFRSWLSKRQLRIITQHQWINSNLVKNLFRSFKKSKICFFSFFLLCHHFRDFNEMRGRGLFVANTKNSVENTLNLGAGYMEVWNYPPVLCYPRDLYTLAVYTRDKKHSAYNLPGQHKQYWPNKAKQKIFFFRQTNSDMLRGLIPNCVNCFS